MTGFTQKKAAAMSCGGLLLETNRMELNRQVKNSQTAIINKKSGNQLSNDAIEVFMVFDGTIQHFENVLFVQF